MTRKTELQQYLAQCVAEFFSTLMLILIGESGIAQYKFSRQPTHSPITINLSFAIGVYTGNASSLRDQREEETIDENNCMLMYFCFASLMPRVERLH